MYTLLFIAHHNTICLEIITTQITMELQNK